MAGVPRARFAERQFHGFATDGRGRFVSLALAERRVECQAVRGQRGVQSLEVARGEPAVEFAASRLATFIASPDRVRQFPLQSLPAGLVGGQRHRHDGRRVLGVPIHRPLRCVVEKGGQFVELFLGERIELVIVAYRATGRQAEPYLGHGFRAIARVKHQILFSDRSAFARRDVTAIETRGDLLIEGAVWKQVAGELFDRELIERSIGVEGVDDPLAIGPDFAEVVEVDAVSIGVARGVKPIASAVLAPRGRLQQFVHVSLVSVGR